MSNNLDDISSNFNSSLLKLIYKWKKHLLIVCVGTIFISSIASYFLKDKYESNVILYPTTTASISKSLISEQNLSKGDILEFGDIEQAEQLIQILNSDEVKNKIVEKYNLFEHYNIEQNDQLKNTKLSRCYSNNISFELTKYMAVKISVLDYDPDTAALIANDIAMLLDTVKNRMRRNIAMEALNIVETEYLYQKDYVEKLEDSLITLRQFGVIDYESQAERLTEQLAVAIVQEKNNAIKAIEDKLSILSKYGGAYVSIRDQLEYEKKQLSFIHAKYKEVKVDAENNLQHKFIVNTATPSEKPVYPIRWLIVFVSTFSVFILSLLILLLFYKN